MWFASAYDNPTVYVVEPEGSVELDSEYPTAGISFACSKAKIIGIHAVPPSVVSRYRTQLHLLALGQLPW